MSKLLSFRRLIRLCSGLCLTCVAVGCGPQDVDRNYQRLLTRAASSSGSFAGTWRVKLKAVQDGCSMGLKGRSYDATVSITQQRNKVTLAIQGFPKSFKGTVSGSTASGTGTYSQDGITLRGSIKVTKTGAKKIRVNQATLKLSSKVESCQLTFSGSGTRS